ncbi:TonB-dependent receptor plug domain-containing protein [Chryseosolibacter indicus]|uniref:TonB-dependent receptor plug domain-containing protein n=1 Tax=Chryseosolibacter indicus TaxID=2782351 RepID=A0ABS5VKZ5_9BACT|nr:TonB-dependent receptor plug domain-containing protein [Chryseosolibacter indicus]MBT1702118.1 TonB-dependent receptor plug domain-containing protein [Chryseosolibacter indicus]
MSTTLIRVVILFFISFSVAAQDLDSLLNMSAYTQESELQKVLNQNLTVSSAKALTTRETPGIISLITAEEIQNAGARDIIDILRLVPGFEIAQDLQFVLGMGLRGSWANEGKVLVMMDGQPFNELLYQGVALGNRFPVDAIERIEIIRGPGSAIYGGSAEYGVINIITKAADKLNGVHVFGVSGFHSNNIGRINGGVSVAQKKDNISWDLSFFKGKGIVSDRPFTDFNGDTTLSSLANVADSDPMNLNVGLKAKGFQIRGMYDEFKTSDPFTYVNFRNYAVDVKYDYKASKKLLITPQLKYYNQIPFQYGYFDTFTDVDGTVYEADEDYLKVRAERYYGSLSFVYDLSRKVNINFGGLYFQDKATDLLKSDYFGANKVSFNNVGFFAQSLLKHRLVNATLGFRYERNNAYGDAFVPRVALTKKIENLHFKILYSQSFRAPSIENINLAYEGKIKPEQSQVFETEIGYQFTPEMLLAVNVFSLRTKDVIVYLVSDDVYKNYPKSGSYGVEMVYSVRKSNWYTNLTYSFSRAGKSSDADPYEIPGLRDQYLAMTSHKFTLNTNFYINKSISLNPTFIGVGKRYAYTAPDVITKLDPYFLANVFLNFKEIYKGFTAGVGVYDLFNEKPSFPQGYNGDYAPVPGRSREFVLKLSYQLNFKK